MAVRDSRLILLTAFAQFLAFAAADKLKLEQLFPVSENEFQSQPTNVAGNIPQWLDGYFLRHSCGAFGNRTLHPKLTIRNALDCFGTVVQYDFQRAKVNVSRVYLNTINYRIWNEKFGRDFEKMNRAALFLFEPWNSKAAFPYRKFQSEGTYSGSAAVSFWKLAQAIKAVDEQCSGILVEPGAALKADRKYRYADDDKSGDAAFANVPGQKVTYGLDPAHEHYDEQGDAWSVVTINRFHSKTSGWSEWLIYKVVQNRHQIVGRFPAGWWDVSSQCDDDKFVSKTIANLPPYMHSFIMTKRYVVLPLTNMLYDYCADMTVNPAKMRQFIVKILTGGTFNGLVEGMLRLEPSRNSRLLIFDRVTKKLVGNITLEAGYLFTHTVNGYEDAQGNIVFESVLSPNGSNIFNGMAVDSLMQRLTNHTDMPPSRVLRLQALRNSSSGMFDRANTEWIPQLLDVEFPHFNQNRRRRQFRYFYMLRNPNSLDNQVIKFDRDTYKTVNWTVSEQERIILFQPVFIPNPKAQSEDDGVVLTAGSDLLRKRSYVYVLDGKTMKQLGVVTHAHTSGIGLHNYFWFRNELGLNSTE